MHKDKPTKGWEAIVADDFRGAVGEATAAIKDLEALLTAEGCMIPVSVTVADDINGGSLTLHWRKVKPANRWRVVALCMDREAPLMELGSPCRLAAYKHLGALGDRARSAMRDAVRKAGLGE